jgi:hypothetical protein
MSAGLYAVVKLPRLTNGCTWNGYRIVKRFNSWCAMQSDKTVMSAATAGRLAEKINDAVLNVKGTNMTTNHTPTPWENQDGISIFSADDHEIANTSRRHLSNAEACANAAHIVRCVNAHDELVAALEAVADAIYEYGNTDVDDIARAQWSKVIDAGHAARAALEKVQA